jgi:hypothetical protein
MFRFFTKKQEAIEIDFNDNLVIALNKTAITVTGNNKVPVEVRNANVFSINHQLAAVSAVLKHYDFTDEFVKDINEVIDKHSNTESGTYEMVAKES